MNQKDWEKDHRALQQAKEQAQAKADHDFAISEYLRYKNTPMTPEMEQFNRAAGEKIPPGYRGR